MSHEAPNANQENSWQSAALISKKILEIKPEDIVNFRQQIKHNNFDIFDKLEVEQQEKMVAIYNMSDVELTTLTQQIQKHQMITHDINLYITTIYELTEDPRFEKLIDKKE